MRLVVRNPSITNEALNNPMGYGNWTIQDVYQKTCLFLNAASDFLWNTKPNDSLLTLHSSLKLESCHFAFCKLILMLQPGQALIKDPDGNLPIHIILASTEIYDKETFLCTDCFSKKNELVSMECENCTSNFCCEDCFQYVSKMVEVKKPSIFRPGM